MLLKNVCKKIKYKCFYEYKIIVHITTGFELKFNHNNV